MLVSMGQLYGDVLCYATSMTEDYYHGRSYSRPESYYYWGYFIFLNTFWMVIPGCKNLKQITCSMADLLSLHLSKLCNNRQGIL